MPRLSSRAARGPFPFKDFDPLHPTPALLPKVGAFFKPDLPTDQMIEQQLRGLGEPPSGAAQWDERRLVPTPAAGGFEAHAWPMAVSTTCPAQNRRTR